MLKKVDHCNVELLLKVREAIEAEKDGIKLNMDWWVNAADCGTSMCIAGWAVHLSDKYALDFETQQAVSVSWGGEYCPGSTAQNLLGLTKEQADALFYPGKSVTADDALRTIDRLILTGEVDWTAD